MLANRTAKRILSLNTNQIPNERKAAHGRNLENEYFVKINAKTKYLEINILCKRENISFSSLMNQILLYTSTNRNAFL